jgi:hypothetical protein
MPQSDGFALQPSGRRQTRVELGLNDGARTHRVAQGVVHSGYWIWARYDSGIQSAPSEYSKEANVKLKLTPPTVVAWVIAVILGVLGILGHFTKIPFVTVNDFWFVAVAFVLLAVATYFEDL